MVQAFTSSLFDGSQVAEDTLAMAAGAKARLATLPPLWTPDHAKPIRDARNAGVGGFPAIIRSDRAETLLISRPGGEVSVRIIAAAAPKGIYLHLHGGGWFMGAADLQDNMLERYADEANVVCVSVDYRLAPEHTFPAALDDSVAVAKWLVDNAADRWGVDRIVVGGDSSGAHLAALTVIEMRDAFDFRFSGAHFVYGFFDLALTPWARQFGEGRSTPRTTDLRGFVNAFIGPEHDRQSPDVSPLYANLVGACPALFIVGTEDALLEDSLFMHMRWMAAGNSSDLQVYPGAPHNFVAMPCSAAADAHDRAIDFIRRRLI